MAGVKTDIEESKKDLAERIEKGNEETRQLKARMDDNDKTFADRVTAVVASLPGFGGLPGQQDDPGSTPVFSSGGQSNLSKTYASCVSSMGSSGDSSSASGSSGQHLPRTSTEDMYWHCRKSLRMWPVLGQGPELKKALGDFLKEKLRMSPLFLSDMGPVAIKRVAAGTGSKIEHEVTVLFSSVQVRDAVRRGPRSWRATRTQESALRSLIRCSPALRPWSQSPTISSRSTRRSGATSSSMMTRCLWSLTSTRILMGREPGGRSAPPRPSR